MVALFTLAAFFAGLFVGNWSTQLQPEDLNPGRASSCETQIAQNVDTLDDESLPDFEDTEDVEAFGTLSDACLRPDVYELIDPVKIDLLARVRARALLVVREGDHGD